MRVSRKQLAYEKLRDQILSLELKPNSPILETDVANEFGVSRTPIREALAALEREGLVTIIRGKGAFVAPSSTNRILETYEVREVLEGLAARLATDRISHVELKELREIFAGYVEGRQKDKNLVLEAADKLHELISESAGNQHLNFLLTQMSDQVSRIRHIAGEGPERLLDSSKEHIKIIDSMLSGDADLAEKMMKEHIYHIRKSLENVLGQR